MGKLARAAGGMAVVCVRSGNAGYAGKMIFFFFFFTSVNVHSYDQCKRDSCASQRLSVSNHCLEFPCIAMS